MKLIALAMILAAGPAIAAETPRPSSPPTSASMYELGVTDGAAMAAKQEAQVKAKSVLDKIQAASRKP